MYISSGWKIQKMVKKSWLSLKTMCIWCEKFQKNLGSIQRWTKVSRHYSVLNDHLVTHWKKKICQLTYIEEDNTHQSWRESSHLKLMMRQRMFSSQLISFLKQERTVIGQNCFCFEKIMRSWEWELSLFIRSFLWWTSYQLKHDKLSRKLSCHFIFSSKVTKLLTRTE